MPMPPVPRTAFFDRIRVTLTALVILHHCAIMFGAQGGWYLKMPTTLAAEQLPLTLLEHLGQFSISILHVGGSIFGQRQHPTAKYSSFKCPVNALSRLLLPAFSKPHTTIVGSADSVALESSSMRQRSSSSGDHPVPIGLKTRTQLI